jgi:hypothetical protein
VQKPWLKHSQQQTQHNPMNCALAAVVAVAVAVAVAWPFG